LATPLVTLAVATLATGAFAAGGPSITLPQGTVVGSTGDGLSHFMGVRYAQPPLRWMPPVAVAAGTATIDAAKPGAGCAQGASPWGKPSTAEDCLFLNLTVPGDAADAGFWQKKPVMVWFHGGGFSGGSAISTTPMRWPRKATSSSSASIIALAPWANSPIPRWMPSTT
jgi:para-nitrobenzyl esterase